MTLLREPEKKIILVSGPTGSGKDTLIECALKTGTFERVITTTSRPRRDNEENGKPYYFLEQEEFESKIENGEFIEHSQNENGAHYGVQEMHLRDAFQRGKKIIWKVDWKGVLNIKKIFPEIKSVCIMASLETLTKRVRVRERTSYPESYFQERLEYAKDYFNHLDIYDYVIWNEDGQLKTSSEKFTGALKEITGT